MILSRYISVVLLRTCGYDSGGPPSWADNVTMTRSRPEHLFFLGLMVGTKNVADTTKTRQQTKQDQSRVHGTLAHCCSKQQPIRENGELKLGRGWWVQGGEGDGGLMTNLLSKNIETQQKDDQLNDVLTMTERSLCLCQRANSPKSFNQLLCTC